MARTDYYNDPNAPEPNSVVPSASAIVTDEQGRVLLVKRRDNTLWALPGGGHDIGESIEQTAIREVKEETGLDVEVTGLVGIYTNPNHIVAFTDGEVRQQFSLCFTTELRGGELAIDHESTDIAWTAPDDIGQLDMHPSMRLRITHYLEQRPAPYLG
ncbi:Putative MutT/NUDIX-like protein [Mycobacteroides abscessus subsp. massiliense]|uniref:NUDIX hydrolase n=1 Tax=Mycobacteroides abscessus TaxID=36809 RepID=UPI0009A8809C|nr:NUDIX domain-containing protein [Mycobacteroides abscessus]SKD28632.1 Putative MutT/NUDIX-like protein [Mycobacteroides abscessus subsp. massiliense]SKF38983.1 Putative MutT/NUDIX-like protein [Mycobacteroides abscessus subsp. massiliense]SKK01242.1 Putative MutT/NUDIX-like protein [Mycobacteroides abscessus subsp. massiliense]SKK75620.1 Putative MutT/NUDIX-like protein [Mycobacteroides abscessus subsp. massiliense]SKM73598.1 Putative MutT/NUDIX-like protein [Mycobacteroides abscessus subsp